MTAQDREDSGSAPGMNRRRFIVAGSPAGASAALAGSTARAAAAGTGRTLAAGSLHTRAGQAAGHLPWSGPSR